MRRIVIAFAAVLMSATAQAQNSTGLSDSAKAIVAVGTWEFSNAERDKICKVAFSAGATRVGLSLRFEPDCAKLFPVVANIAGWRFPQDDLLYMVDGKGQAVIEFSEVEDGIFEAPTPGVGVLFLQNPAAAGPPPKAAEQMTGDWTVVRGDRAICSLTLAKTPAGDGFALTVKPGCDASVARHNFTQWMADRGELVLVPAEGDVWRFEETDGRWRLLSETGEPISLVQQ